MKKIIQKLSLGLLLATGLTTSSFAQNWQNVGTAGFSAGRVDYLSSAINASGELYVAFNDSVNSHKATVMKFDGTAWVNVGTAGFSDGVGSSTSAEYTSIAIDAAGVPYVVCSDWGNSQKATVKKFDGTNWVSVGTAGFSTGLARYTTIAINASGVPYVAFRDVNGFNANGVTVMRFNGTNWVDVGMTGFSAGAAESISIAIDNAGVPYVAFRDGGNSNKATVMKFDGTTWVNVGTAGFSPASVIALPLAIDNAGVPYVAFRDGGNSNKASVMKFNGTAWVNVGTAGFSNGDVYFDTYDMSLAINATGEPYLAFKTGANGYMSTDAHKTTVMKYNGSSWVNVGTACFSPDKTSYTSLVLNAAGEPYVAFQDYGNSNKATVMKFVEMIPYTITTSANPSAGGTVTGGGNHNDGTSVTLTANANTGYTFTKWTENGTDISTANPYIFTASTNRTLVAEFEPTTGISKINTDNFVAVYPNPANTILHIETKENTNITIVNLLGAVVAAQQLQTGNNTVDVSSLSKGVYFISSDKGGATKFIKQ